MKLAIKEICPLSRKGMKIKVTLKNQRCIYNFITQLLISPHKFELLFESLAVSFVKRKICKYFCVETF